MYWPYNVNFAYNFESNPLYNQVFNYVQQENGLYWPQYAQNQYQINTINSTIVNSNFNQTMDSNTFKNISESKSGLLKNELLIQQDNILKEQYQNKEQNKKQKKNDMDPKSIMKIIQLIITNININETEIQVAKKLLQQKEAAKQIEIFQILLRKFKKLHKTKEQSIKYCMRKAFKYISEFIKNNDQGYDGRECMKYLFSKYEQQQNFSVPFKKSSSTKSLNSFFLIKIFKSQKFTEMYLEFLKKFKQLSWEDNINKIFILCNSIQQSINQNKIQNIQTFSRLPWTLEIINKSYQIAEELLKFSPYQQKINNILHIPLKVENDEINFIENLIENRANMIPVKKQNKYKKRQKKLMISHNSTRFTRSKLKKSETEPKQFEKKI